MSALAVEIAPEPHATIVTLNGAADLAGSSELDRKLTILSAQRPAHLIFDLSNLSFISSLAMGSLIRFAHGIANHGGRVAIAGAQPMVAEALRRIRMESVMPMFATVQEAAASA